MCCDVVLKTNLGSKARWLRADAIVLLVTGVVLVLFRLHAFDLPLETDECNYAYIGQQLLEGDRLYVDVWDHQPPGVFGLFAGVIAVFGSDPVVFRWLATAASLVTLIGVYGCSLRAFGRICAICTGFLFAIVSSDPGTGGEGCNREIFMNALIAVSWYAVLHRDRPQLRHLFIAGVALGLASVLKTVVAVHWLTLVVAVVLNRLWVRSGDACTNYQPAPNASDRSDVPVLQEAGAGKIWLVLLDVSVLGIGPALTWVFVTGFFGATGRLAVFCDAVFGFNVGYSEGGGSFFSRFILFFVPPRHPFVFDSAIALWVVAGVATAWLIVRALRRDRACVILLAWIVGAYLAACLPSRFWPHYYYLLVPPACIAAAWVCCRTELFFRRQQVPTRTPKAIGCCLIVLFVFVTEYRSYLDESLFGITVKRYNSRDFWGRGQGANIKRVTDPNDKVFVYGNDASLYYYADRKCASRYTMITGIGTGMVGADVRRRIMIDELRADPPRLIVILFDEPPFPEWKTFLDEFYGQPVGADFHDKTRKPIMYVMVRKDQPIEPIDWDWDRSSVGGWQLGERLR